MASTRVCASRLTLCVAAILAAGVVTSCAGVRCCCSALDSAGLAEKSPLSAVISSTGVLWSRRRSSRTVVQPASPAPMMMMIGGAMSGPSVLNLYRLKVGLGDAAVRAGPGVGHIRPARAGGDAIFRATRGLVINIAANDAKVGFHEYSN